MSNLQWIGTKICVAVVFGLAIRGQADGLQSSGSLEEAAKLHDQELQLSDRASDAFAEAINEIVGCAKQAGKSDKAAKWEKRHKEPVMVSCVVAALEECEKLRLRNELKSAQRLSTQLSVVGDECKKSNPILYTLAQLNLSYLDIDFERYDSALRRFNSAMDLVKTPEQLPLSTQMELNTARAYFLLKQGKHAEAQRIYIQFLKDAHEHPDSASNDMILTARFAIAATYADMAEFEKCAAVGPFKWSDVYEDGDVNSWRVFLLYSSRVKCFLYKIKDFDAAAKECQQLVDKIQRDEGTSSPLYAESIELMVKVKVEQSQYFDALELLEKSSRIRKELFGDDHPSIIRIHSEIDRVRKLALDQKTPILVISTEDREVVDRYGTAKASDAAVKEAKK